jgi:hypothetical protein
MAMDTLCLEFESEHEGSFVAGFMHMHFNHTWAFISQRSKLVDGRPLVEGVTDFQKIIDAFSECTYLGDPKRLRLTVAQIQELDTFMSETLKGATFVNSVSSKTPFFDYVSSNRLSCGDSIVDKNVEKAMGGAA